MSLQVSAMVIDVHKGPALDALGPLVVGNLDVFEDRILLLFSAVKVIELFLKPLIGHLRFLDCKFSTFGSLPINFGKEWVLFNFVSSLFTCS